MESEEKNAHEKPWTHFFKSRDQLMMHNLVSRSNRLRWDQPSVLQDVWTGWSQGCLTWTRHLPFFMALPSLMTFLLSKHVRPFPNWQIFWKWKGPVMKLFRHLLLPGKALWLLFLGSHYFMVHLDYVYSGIKSSQCKESQFLYQRFQTL